MYPPNIHATIKKQMLTDIAHNVNPYEVRAKAAGILISGYYVDTELQARTLANAWYECLTCNDLPELSRLEEVA